MKALNTSNKLYLFILLFIFVASAHAASSSLIKQTGFRTYSAEQGLSQNTINHIFQDKQRYIWISTAAGLNRLDGHRTITYLGPNNAFSSAAIIFLKQDSQDDYWISTFEGLTSTNNEFKEFETFSIPSFTKSQTSENFVIDIIEETKNLFWVISGEGIFSLNKSTREIGVFPSMKILTDNTIWLFSALNHDNEIWLTTNKGIYVFNKTDKSLTQYPLPESLQTVSIVQIYPYDEQHMIFSSSRGIYKISKNIQSAKLLKLFDANSSSSDIKAIGHDIYFAIGDKLHHIDSQTDQVTHLFSLSEMLPKYTAYTINTLFVDASEKLWIGTESQGALVWDPKSVNFQSVAFKTRNPNLQLNNDVIWSFAQDEKGNYWIGSDKGLTYLDTIKQTKTTLISEALSKLDSESVRVFKVIQIDNALWLATGDGLIRYSIDSGKIESFRPKFLSQDYYLFIYSMATLNDRTLWLATDRGAMRFDIEKLAFRRESKVSGESQDETTTFVKTLNNRIWFGFKDKLISYDPLTQQTRSVFQVQHKTKSSDLYLTDFFIEDDKLWTSFSGEGIYVSSLSDPSYKILHHFTPRDGFPDGIVYSLIPYKDQLWASSHSGLIQIDTKSYGYQVFNYYDGLPGNEFNEGATLTNRDGEIMFGGNNGIIFLDPSNISTQPSIPKPAVSEVRIEERKLTASAKPWAQRKIQLSSNESFIQFKLSTLDFLKPKSWQYRYWLEGEKALNKKLTKESELFFTDLKAGNYQLFVETISLDGKTSSQPTKLDFTVETPFWLSPTTTQISYALLAIIAFLYLYRRSQIKERILTLYGELKDKERRLELVLLDQRRGIWEWHAGERGIPDSKLEIILSENERISLTLNEYIQLIHPNDRERLQEKWSAFLSGEKEEFGDVYRVNLFEQWLWSRVYGRIYEKSESDKPLRAIGSWLDISEEKNAEDRLKLYKSAVQHTQDIVIIADQHLDIISANDSFSKLTGHTVNKLIGRNILRVAKSTFSYDFVKLIISELKQKQSWRGELIVPRNNGTGFSAYVTIDSFENSAGNHSLVVVITDISGTVGKQNRASQSPYHDLDTGLPNKALLKDRLTHAIDHAKTHHTRVALITFEIIKRNQNQTKGKSKEIYTDQVNQLIRALPSLLSPDDTLARVKKDRFLIIIEDDDTVERIIFRIDKVLTSFNLQLEALTSNKDLTIVSGISNFPEDAKNGTQLIENSALAMKSVNEHETRTFRYSNKQTHKLALEKIGMKNAINTALAEDEFFLVYQPKVELYSKKVIGFEVLIRWRTSEGRLIYPSQFLEIAEQAGLLQALTRWLCDNALEALSRFKAQQLDIAFSLNLVPAASKNSSLLDYILNKIKEFELKNSDIHLEINEKALINSERQTFEIMELINSHGIKVTIDDFGKWQLPFSKLKSLPIYAVKMHRDYTRAIGKDKVSEAILKTIHHLCEQLDIKFTTKGIETESQVEYLRSINCAFGQGYYFSDPLSEAEAIQYVKSNNEKTN